MFLRVTKMNHLKMYLFSIFPNAFSEVLQIQGMILKSWTLVQTNLHLSLLPKIFS